MRYKKPIDPRGSHVRIYSDILDSPAWIALDYSAQALYLAMRNQLKGSNNGNISCTLTYLRPRGFNSSATLAKALRSLQAVGLIAMTKQGGIAFGQKVCSLYRFTDVESHDHPKIGLTGCHASNEWKRVRSVEHARAVIVARSMDESSDMANGSGIQKLKARASTSEASAENAVSEIEAVPDRRNQKVNQARHAEFHESPHVRSLCRSRC